MTFVSTAPLAVSIVLVLAMLVMALRPQRKVSHRLFAGFSFMFLCFSLYVINREGVFGFWTEHTRNLWGNQIWFDLLLMAFAVWALILERASKLKMNNLIWLLVILCSGSVGALLMISRVFYLESKLRVNLAAD